MLNITPRLSSRTQPLIALQDNERFSKRGSGSFPQARPLLACGPELSKYVNTTQLPTLSDGYISQNQIDRDFDTAVCRSTNHNPSTATTPQDAFHFGKDHGHVVKIGENHIGQPVVP
jgi:hypothetical protein